MIRKRRQALDWDQRDLAERVGVHVNSVQKWESGTHYPGRKLGKLEEVLGIRLDTQTGPPLPVARDDWEAGVLSDPGLSDHDKRQIIASIRRAKADLYPQQPGAAPPQPRGRDAQDPDSAAS